MKSRKNYMLITIQHSHLPYVFDFSTDWFEKRIDICFFQDVHFFQKKGIKSKIWDVVETKKALLKYLSNRPSQVKPDSEIEELLKRR